MTDLAVVLTFLVLGSILAAVIAGKILDQLGDDDDDTL